MRMRETGVWVGWWKDEGRQWPHEAPGAVVLLRNMLCVCVCASEILPASLWHSLLSLLSTRLCMKNNIHPLKEVQSLCPILVNIGFWTHYFHSIRRVQIKVDNTNHYSMSIIPSAIRLLKTYSILRDCKLPLNLVIWTTTKCFVDCYSLYWPL